MRRLAVPPQHGAWAFLIVPTVASGLVGSGMITGWLFAVTWVLAYPASYFLGRALNFRIRRGTWSRKAKAELNQALPWLVFATLGAVSLLVLQPAIVLGAIPVALMWLMSLWLTYRGRERGILNDLLLVLLASIAPILMWVASSGNWEIPTSQWIVVAVSALFFTGSVLHVKSLIRESKDKRWRIGSIAYSLLCIPVSALISPWLIPAFGLAAVRALIVPRNSRPGVIGGVEALISVVMIVCIALTAN